ncbi:hypothetical protein [Streptomyces yaizuensis]|uniref:Uncharacterized protein n=1 Tax=Streptomyces yaizuensis TaxID=2989713 RepID=A0AA86IVH0_9ACTN|nr:hypothetical protein [Streptomyces sp. YSPA8]BDT39584.1 hypothetical protein SYYSPA8_37330 [Streptomyces sp. YSPA8]
MTRPIDRMSVSDIQEELRADLSLWPALDKPGESHVDLNVLRDGKTNQDNAAKYFVILHQQEWEPLSGYPGSDTHWKVLCRRCGWEGNMFNSHMRRNRRHKSCGGRLTDTGALRVLARVAVNRLRDPRHPFGRNLGYALDDLVHAERAEKLAGDSAAPTGLHAVLLGSALRNVRQALDQPVDGPPFI